MSVSPLSPESWQALLQRLGPNAGEEYETLRRKLVKFFDWRQAREPEVLADETVDRVARKLAAGETIGELSAYCYAVAKLILLEDAKRGARRREVLAELPPPEQQIPGAGEDSLRECFDECLRRLAPETRKMIIEYYQDDKSAKIERRKSLADRLGVPLNALRIRACRVRAELEDCVKGCTAR